MHCIGDMEAAWRRCLLFGRLDWAVLALGILLALSAGPLFAGEPNLPTPTPEKLGGKDRTLAFLSTDKPIYKPGEDVYFRAVALQADTFFPLREQGKAARLVITGPKKDELASFLTVVVDSTAGFSWKIPAELAGGRYLARVEVDGGAPAERGFEIRAYQPPRLKTQIEFLREGYGPGDAVQAVVKVTRAEGGVPSGARVTAVARVEGLSVDADGNCRAEFPLPAAMDRGEGTLAFVIEDGGVVETASKTIPILLQTMDIAFYPEGGDLIEGLPSRVYIQARRPDGKPADIAGVVVRTGADGKEIAGTPAAELRTVHEGRGWFEFTPRRGESYALRLNQPSGIAKLFPLPAAIASGAVIRADKPVYDFADPVTLSVQATPDSRAALVTLYQREKLVSKADLGKAGDKVTLDPGEAEGVLMATVWNASGKPLAERLIFRRAKFSLNIAVTAESEPAGASPTPGGKVRLNIATTDENGRPVEAVVGLSVADDALLEMVEKRDQAPSLPVMVYLENEVKDLADAQVYLDPANPDAARDLDLLLGTQGWRRFVLVRLDEALKTDPEAVKRALAIRVPPPPPARPVPMAMGFGRGNMQMMRQEDVDWEEDGNVAEFAAAMPMMAAPAAVAEENIVNEVMDALPAPAPVGALGKDDIRVNAEFDIVRQREIGPVADAQKILAPRFEPAWKEEKRAIAPRRPMPKPEALVSIREYAHKVRANRRPNDRVDFAETLYWNAGIRTNPRDGKASVSFDLSDSVTTFRVLADAFANNGALGAATREIASVEPFYVEAKLPPVVVEGDRLDIPAVLVNATAKDLGRPGLVVKSDTLRPETRDLPAKLGPTARERVIIRVPADKAGDHSLTLNAAAGGYTDTVTRTLRILPRGFPVQETASGMVGPDKAFSRPFDIAADIVPGSISATVKIYPTPLANMEEALNALLRQPTGCFEQASSTNYPLVMAQQYFTSHVGVSPDKIRRAGALLDDGYRRLIGYECKEKGYEWFGGDPGHEALTAYGLMQFTEMRRIMPVDEAMINRTRDWLLSRRDGKGGFERNPQALDSFGAAPAPLTDLYILWTLLESGEKPETLKAEIEAARKLVSETKDPYLKALGANILFLAGDQPAAKAAADFLKSAQAKDGGLDGAETSITRSGGESLRIETTSLAIIAWLRCGDEYAGTVEKAMSWLFELCKAGRFGTTQSTILALKAINAYDAARAKPKAPGTVRLEIDGQPFGNPVAFDEKSQGALELPDFSAALTSGRHQVAVVMTGGGDMPFALEISYNSPQPANSAECPLSLETSLSSREVREGDPVDLRVVVAAGDKDVSMPLAIVGMPGGLEPRHERLKELVASGAISSYEILGRDLVLYWRTMKANDKADVAIPMIAEIPGVYTAPASRVYAYYLDEHKNWAAGEKVTITAR